MAMTPIGVLIQRQQEAFLDQHGVELTYADIARKTGGVLTRGHVQQLASEERKEMPKQKTLHALADALGIEREEMVQAALAAAGYLVEGEFAVARLTGQARRRRNGDD
jgi:transcriptional regulator with XRE-family HTH domain